MVDKDVGGFQVPVKCVQVDVQILYSGVMLLVVQISHDKLRVIGSGHIPAGHGEVAR